MSGATCDLCGRVRSDTRARRILVPAVGWDIGRDKDPVSFPEVERFGLLCDECVEKYAALCWLHSPSVHEVDLDDHNARLAWLHGRLPKWRSL